MAVRIRKDGQILCAAQHPAKLGDQYIDDDTHYWLSVIKKLLVTEPMLTKHGGHCRHGEWWWKDQVPIDATIDEFYLNEETK